MQSQLQIGRSLNPVTSDPLGSSYRRYPAVTERIQQRITGLEPELALTERAEAIAAIEAEETVKGARKAVAGFGFTFSIPKSPSVLWAVSDAGT